MNPFVKLLLAAFVVLGCVGVGALAGCEAGAAVVSGAEKGLGALASMLVGALVGLIGGALLAARSFKSPPPRE